MANGKQLREMLAKTREQKFRKKTEARLLADVAQKELIRLKWQEEEYRKNCTHAASIRAINTNAGDRLNAPEVKKKSIQRLRERLNREVTTPFGVFESRKLMDESLQQRFPHTNFIRRMESLPHLYYYTDQGPGPVKTESVYQSPYGKAPSVMWHLEKAVATGCPEAAKVKNPCNDACIWFNKMKKRNPKEFYKTREDAREWLEFGIKKYPNRIRT